MRGMWALQGRQVQYLSKNELPEQREELPAFPGDVARGDQCAGEVVPSVRSMPLFSIVFLLMRI